MERKIVQAGIVSQKDDNGQYQPMKPSPLPKKKRVRKPKPGSINLSELMEDYLVILQRETKNLMLASVPGPLSKDAANSAREYMRLIADLKKKEKELLSELTPEEIDALIKGKK